VSDNWTLIPPNTSRHSTLTRPLRGHLPQAPCFFRSTARPPVIMCTRTSVDGVVRNWVHGEHLMKVRNAFFGHRRPRMASQYRTTAALRLSTLFRQDWYSIQPLLSRPISETFRRKLLLSLIGRYPSQSPGWPVRISAPRALCHVMTPLIGESHQLSPCLRNTKPCRKGRTLLPSTYAIEHCSFRRPTMGPDEHNYVTRLPP